MQTMKQGDLTSEITRHVVLMFGGFVIIYIVHHIPFKAYKMFSPAFLLFVILCLALAPLTSGEISKRWLFSRSLQPSEWAKVVMIVYLAKVLSDGFGGSIKEFLLRVIVPIAIVCCLIILAHVSTTMIIGLTSMIMVFMGAPKWKYRLVSVLFVVVTLFAYSTLHDYLKRGTTASNRYNSWVENVFGSTNKAGTAVNKNGKTSKIIEYEQSKTVKYAIISGGLLGKSPGKSVYRKTLTEAHNDYIFAIIIEEYGLIFGGIGIIGLYLILFYRILLVIKKCNMAFTSLLLSGLFILIITQTFIHIGVSVGGLPITGQNLPMISTGGSSLFITCLAFGMILSVSRADKERELNDNKKN
jgi:cell division protein FtsW